MLSWVCLSYFGLICLVKLKYTRLLWNTLYLTLFISLCCRRKSPWNCILDTIFTAYVMAVIEAIFDTGIGLGFGVDS